MLFICRLAAFLDVRYWDFLLEVLTAALAESSGRGRSLRVTQQSRFNLLPVYSSLWKSVQSVSRSTPNGFSANGNGSSNSNSYNSNNNNNHGSLPLMHLLSSAKNTLGLCRSLFSSEHAGRPSFEQEIQHAVDAIEGYLLSRGLEHEECAGVFLSDVMRSLVDALKAATNQKKVFYSLKTGRCRGLG